MNEEVKLPITTRHFGNLCVMEMSTKLRCESVPVADKLSMTNILVNIWLQKTNKQISHYE